MSYVVSCSQVWRYNSSKACFYATAIILHFITAAANPITCANMTICHEKTPWVMVKLRVVVVVMVEETLAVMVTVVVMLRVIVVGELVSE